VTNSDSTRERASASGGGRSVQRPVRWAILLGATAVIVYLCAAILGPFVDVLAWSSVLAIAFYPVHERLLKKTGRPTLSALICTSLIVVTIVIPLLVVAALAVNQVLAVREYVDQALSRGVGLDTLAPVRAAAESVVRRLGIDPSRVTEALAQHAAQAGQLAAGYALAFAAGITGAIVTFIFTIFATFFMLRDGSAIAERIPGLLPFERPRSEAVLRRIREVIYASVYGVLVIAGIQGLLMGLTFSVLGIPSAALWGVVTVFTSMIPLLGAGIVWVPGAIYLLLGGHWVKAVALAIIGGAVISSVDNVLRPRLVGGRVGLSQLVVFFAVLGGLQVFGILGVIVGPVVFAVALSLLEALSEAEPNA